MPKLCFVTTGATAPFTALIESILSPASINALLECQATHLLIQYGAAKDVYEASAKTARDYLKQQGKAKQLEIDGMDFDSNGLREQFKSVQETKGLAVSHAGKLHIHLLILDVEVFLECATIPQYERLHSLPRCSTTYKL